MRNPLVLVLGMAVLTALLGTTPMARAQVPGAACPPPLPQVTVAVDYVSVSWPDYLRAKSRLAPGPNPDARLLNALHRAGARDEQAPRITTVAGTPGTITLTVTPPAPLPRLTSSTQITPRLNPDGTITVAMTLHRETLAPDTAPGALVPATIITQLSTRDTFTDGQTRLVNGMSDGAAPGLASAPLLLVFATATRVKPAAPQVKASPSLGRP